MTIQCTKHLMFLLTCLPLPSFCPPSLPPTRCEGSTCLQHLKLARTMTRFYLSMNCVQFIPLYKGNWSPAPHTGSVDATVSGDTWCCREARPGSGRALLNQPAKVSWPLCFEAARETGFQGMNS